MKISFLGTGTSQGVPVIACNCAVCQSENQKDKRLRSSILIEINGINIVIDTGPDFRQQMLRANVKTLDGILFTHEHKDHVAGLDDIRAFNYAQKKPMDVFAEKRVQEALVREFSYIFAKNKYPGVPEVHLHEIENLPFYIKGIKIIAIRVMHLKLPILGFRIGDVSYITDANFISETEKDKIRGSKLLILNALRIQKHISHFNLSEALALIEELKPERALLTHISHMIGFHTQVSKVLPPNVTLSFDGLSIEL